MIIRLRVPTLYQGWHIQLPWLQEIRRWLFLKCSWCGGPSRKGHAVNHGYMGGSETFHADCMSPEHAWRSCSCATPLFESWTDRAGNVHTPDHGKCLNCDRFRKWIQSPEESAVYAYIRETTPPHTPMSPEVKAEVHRRWDAIRAAKESQDD